MSAELPTLRLELEGFFQCRLATDPDPPSETRGVSGYTFALAGESDLDQVIRLQRDEIAERDFRQPFPPYLAAENPQFGVFVRRVTIAGREVPESPFQGAPVRWPGRPQFELRNQIVADGFNRLVPVIVPFAIEIRGHAGALLYRSDPLDPEHPDLQIWQLRPEQYQRRVGAYFFNTGSEVIERLFAQESAQFSSLDAFYNAYFQARQEWLELEISKVESLRAAGGPPPEYPYDLQLEALRTRIFSIDQHTGTAEEAGRIENRLGIQTVWEFPIVGDDARAEGLGGVEVATDRPWRTRFWMGGWDGDLLIGYLKGWLEVPISARAG